MNHAPLTPFEFSRDGHSNRRDADAEPRVLVTAITGPTINFHCAGDTYLRTANVVDAVDDTDLISGMQPGDSLRLGIAVGRLLAGGSG